MAEPTRAIAGSDIAERLGRVPEAVVETGAISVTVAPEKLVEASRFLRDDRDSDARFLNCLSGVDRYDYFEVVYHLSSLAHNHSFVLRVRADHEEPEVPSLAGVWHGAHLQEREIFDLLGIRFIGHPDLKRMLLWEGFPGHPLRKDFMSLPSGKSPGLQRFPKEDPEKWGGEFRGD